MEILINLPEQMLLLFRDGSRHPIWTAPVSTALAGAGEIEGSFKTPRGKHRISEKIGAGDCINTIFKSRVSTGNVWDGTNTDEDLILSRILRLDGLEQFNRNSHQRYIYIHGTNHEWQIGTPVSHGCIRMRNIDVIELFDRVETGTLVDIHETRCYSSLCP